MRKALLILSLLLLKTSFSFSQKTALETVNAIKKELNCEWQNPTVDTFKAGDSLQIVKGIAFTFMATWEVLEKAKKLGCNLIITHEPTFYHHLDIISLRDYQLTNEKKDFIEKNGLVVWRFHDHMHKNSPDLVYQGVLEKMGWINFWDKNTNILNIPPTKLSKLKKQLKTQLGAKTMRSIGPSSKTIQTIGLVLGAAGSEAHFAMLKQNPDLLIVGESNEWETIPYIFDDIYAHGKSSIIVLGHCDSEEAGMAFLKKWFDERIGGTNTYFIPSNNPFSK